MFRARNLFEAAADTVVYWERYVDCTPPLDDRSGAIAPFIETYESGSLKIRIYPNPAMDELIVAVAAEYAFSGEMMLFDLSGRLVQRAHLNFGVNRLNLSLPAGIYVACLFDGKGVISRNKIVIIR